jgi:hypothetical protein
MAASSMSLEAFNSTLVGFIEQLQVLFSKNNEIKAKLTDVRSGLDIMLASKSTERKPMEMFVEAVKPYVHLIRDRDDRFFTEHMATMPFLGDLDLHTVWTTGRVSEDNKAAIWQYLNILSLCGVTIASMPPEAMAAVEEIAKSIVGSGTEGAMETVAALTGGGGGGGGGGDPFGGFNPMALMGILGGGKK